MQRSNEEIMTVNYFKLCYLQTLPCIKDFYIDNTELHSEVVSARPSILIEM